MTEPTTGAAPPDAAGDDARYDPAAHRTMGLLRRVTVEVDQYVEQFRSAHGMHRTDLNALAVLSDSGRSGDGGPMTPGRLSAVLRMSSAATTALVDRLERAGHLHRRRSHEDARRVELETTDTAKAVGATMFRALGRAIGAVIDRRTPEERAVIDAFLADVVDAARRARDEVSGGGDGPDPRG